MEADPTDTAGSLEFRVLGDVEVVVNGRPLALGGRKSRELLAFLLLHGNETVSQTRIVEALWGDDAPLTVEASLRVSVSKLRKTLEPVGARDFLETRPAGYVLRVERDLVDTGQFELLATAGRRDLAQGAADEASTHLRNALALWRGEPFEVIANLADADVERRRLGEIRLDTQDDLSQAQLALGLHNDIVPELEALVAQQPARERRAAQLMLALYRCGRQADALEVYRSLRTALRDELGLEPGPDLRALEQAILRQDPELSAPVVGVSANSRPDGLPSHSRRRMLLWAVVVALGSLIACALLWIVVGSSATSVALNPNSAVVIDQHSRDVGASAPTGSFPLEVVLAGGSASISNSEEDTVTQVDVRTRRVVRTIGLGFEPTGVSAGGGAVWVVGGYDHQLARIDTADGLIRLRVSFEERLGPLPAGYERGVAGVAVGAGGVWVAHGVELTLFDARTGAPLRTVRAGGPWAGHIAVGAGSVWVAYDGRLTPSGRVDYPALDAVDPATGRRRARIPLVSGVGDIEVADHAVWVALPIGDAVWLIDPRRLTVASTVSVGEDPVSIAVDDGLWVSNGEDSTVTLFDQRSASKLAEIPVGHKPRGIAAHDGEVWVVITNP